VLAALGLPVAEAVDLLVVKQAILLGIGFGLRLRLGFRLGSRRLPGLGRRIADGVADIRGEGENGQSDGVGTEQSRNDRLQHTFLPSCSPSQPRSTRQRLYDRTAH